MNKYPDLKLEVNDGIGVLTIVRESKLNALNEAVIEQLEKCLLEVEALKLSGLILTGEGEKAFIAGADIAAMSQMGSEDALKFAQKGQKVTLQLENLNCPTIAAVNGFALGGGLEFALACDFILATENAVFALPEVSLGLVPGFGGTQRLAKIIGRNLAKYFIFTGEKFKASQAQEMGLVVKVLPNKTELLEESTNIIKAMQKNSRWAIKSAKEVINQGIDLPNEQGLNLEARQFGAIFDSYDKKEGTSAFLEKRKAEFKGE